jgi:hypothetical protein
MSVTSPTLKPDDDVVLDDDVPLLAAPPDVLELLELLLPHAASTSTEATLATAARLPLMTRLLIPER